MIVRAFIRFAALALVVLVAASCSIEHRSDKLTCSGPADCTGGRSCIDGYCVFTGTLDASKSDAPKPPGDSGNSCPSPCTSCNVAQKTCTVDCTLTSCANTITCPPGFKCDIQCKGDGACKNGVNCTQAAACNVECTSSNSCRNVMCGPGPCSVNCSGQSSCRGVTCGQSCACDVICSGPSSCQNPTPVCNPFACTTPNGLGCTSVPALCHSCQ